MRKRSLHLMFFLVVLLVANFAVPSGASGQQQRYYPPYELYQFYMNGRMATGMRLGTASA
jgi:hypothetical protein